MSHRNIVLVISSLAPGGSERVLARMANYWAGKGWRISLLTLDRDAPFYELEPSVNHIALGVTGHSRNAMVGILKNVRRIRELRRAIKALGPDAVVSFGDQTNVLTLLATGGLKTPVIVAERVDPRLYSIGWMWERLRRWTYPFADRIVVQTGEAAKYFGDRPRRRVSVVPNPVVIPEGLLVEPARRRGHCRVIIAMGRLTKQKGFDLLLQAFARIAGEHPDWNLTIIGDGEMRPALESQRGSLGLQGRIEFTGIVKKPGAFFGSADVFVLSSRFEGFPNALCEAMACGLPAVSFDCPSGPAEIIRDGIDGILVPDGDVGALASAMDRLMSDEAERKRLASRASEVVSRFSLERIMGLWEELLDHVAGRNHANSF